MTTIAHINAITVVKVVATIECDGCGCYFEVEPDAAVSTAGRAIWHHAVDAVWGCSWLSVEDDKAFCKSCTRKRAAESKERVEA